MKKFLSVMLLAVTLIFVSNNAATAQGLNFVPLTTGSVYAARVVYGIDFLALRSGPSVNYREITRIPPGAYIEVIRGGEDNYTNFERVKYNGYSGWSHRRYIEIVGKKYDIP